jgi:hypothetical protein
MTERFAAERYLDGLKGFQRATVAHVDRRFFEDDHPTRRFLVADETGLGKSMVARGVIARTIERLQDDDSVGRIDVLYVCSNAAIAGQNLKRLDVLDSGGIHHSTRLTLLARDSGDLEGEPDPRVGKKVNLISFTPGTSFDLGDSTGRADERALLHVILAEAVGWSRKVERRSSIVLRGSSGIDRFRRRITNLWTWFCSEGRTGPDEAITNPFLSSVRGRGGLLERYERAVDDVGQRQSLSANEETENGRLVGELRAALARAGIDALEPDLVILDEFQRFRHLLAVDDPRYQEAAELAHTLFGYGDTKVLLLSATPYKPFTFAEEAASGDDHQADVQRTLSFLAATDGGGPAVDAIVTDLAAFRRAAVNGEDTDDLRTQLQDGLTTLMCRTERPQLGDDGMLCELAVTAEDVRPEDIVGYAALRRLATELDAPMAVDYWKSTPYFVNFGDGYKLGDRLRERLATPEGRHELRGLLAATQHLDAAAVERFEPIDPGNARMRRLFADTVEQGWWRLLWMPPSLPYAPPGGPYAEPGIADMTKRLIFSSWAATPTAIASLLSYEATRQIAGSRERLDSATARLDWRTEDGRPSAMTTLALFWPAPELASRFDPLADDGVAVASASSLTPATTTASTGGEPWYWTTILGSTGAMPAALDAATATRSLSGETDESNGDESSGLRAHVDLAMRVAADRDVTASERRTRPPDDLDTRVAELARFTPGNVAWRCVDRLTQPGDGVTALGRWQAAAVLASGLRSLFNRPESMLLLDREVPGTVYWRAVLRYCAWGNLEAVLDEYLHHLAATDRQSGLDDAKLLALAFQARAAITPLPSRYQAFDPLHPDRRIAFPSRFALRYGSRRATDDENGRLPEIREAFNSPFQPFVLATTSVGQEGIDFHWWCRAAVHWNIPASPVDFEQREGRVHRFGGLAIRRNLASLHCDAIRSAAAADGAHPWDEAFKIGITEAPARHDELAPHWITEGPSKIERHVMPYPLSSDHARYRQLKDDLALYRLTFGQPRQEDMLGLLAARGLRATPSGDDLALDLRPPTAAGTTEESRD